MGEHNRNQNSILKSEGALDPAQRVKPLTCQVGVNKEAKKVVLVYGLKINNVSYDLPQLAKHIGALVGAGRAIDADFMATEIML